MLPHQIEFGRHSNHGKSYDFQYLGDQEPVQYDMQFVHAFPMAMVAYPLTTNKTYKHHKFL